MTDHLAGLPREARGFWHRPHETDLDQVRATLAELKRLNMNQLFVETWFGGRLIFPHPDAVLPPHDFVGHYGPYGRHLLKAFIEEGAKSGIDVHAWVENFFIGIHHKDNPVPFLKDRQDWVLVNHDGSTRQKHEADYVFLDPANTQVLDHLERLYDAMVDLEGLASLHLDYIRYPVAYRTEMPDYHDDHGFTHVAENRFKLEYGYHGDVRVLVLQSKACRQDWHRFKIRQINGFVERLTTRYRKRIRISTAVFGNPAHALDVKCQDWQTWIKRGWIDILVPMAYDQDVDRVASEIRQMCQINQERCALYAGLAPGYLGLGVEHVIAQVEAVRQTCVQGVVLFATQNHLVRHFMGTSPGHEHDQDVLVNTVFKPIG